MDDSYYDYRFSGIARVYGQTALEKLKSSHVLVVGLGGVGSWVVEALARSGVGAMSLVDFDDVCTSNFNRQIHALDSTVGQLKSEVLKKRVLQINKTCQLTIHDKAYSRDTEKEIFCQDYDYAVDAIDVSLLKEHFIVACRERKIPLTVVGSTGGKKDPTKIKVEDLSRTRDDIMLKIIRKNLRQQYGFPRGKDKFKIKAVYSCEAPVYPKDSGEVTTEKPESHKKPLDCQTGMGAVTFLTGAVAFHTAATVVDHLMGSVSSR